MVRVKEVSYGVKQGNVYGSLKVIGKPFSTGHKQWRVVVECECGRTVVSWCVNLSSKKSTQCQGCNARKRSTIHGDAPKEYTEQKRLYHIWQNMRARCNCKTNPAYKWYGERGIKVCEEWGTYAEFRKWALGGGYKPGLSIDRIDNDKGYSPENCRWATAAEQVRNTRANHMITHNGETLCIVDWEKKTGVHRKTIRERLKRGFSVERALGKTKCLK